MTHYAETVNVQGMIVDGLEKIMALPDDPARTDASDQDGNPVLARDGDQQMALALRAAWPYYWTTHVCELVQAGFETAPDYALALDQLPTNAGFCLFESPLPLPAHGDWATGPLTAFCWQGRYSTRSGREYVSIITMSDHSEAQDAPWREQGLPAPAAVRFLPVSITPWYIGETLGRTVARIPPGSRSGAFEVLEEPLSESRADVGRDAPTRLIRSLMYVSAAILFLNETIVRRSRTRLPRSYMRRLSKQALPSTEVDVVSLRRVRYERHEGSDEEGVPDWSCQWIVRGHWRQQWYASMGVHRPKWVTPYVKGPEDKPLKVSKGTIFDVVR